MKTEFKTAAAEPSFHRNHSLGIRIWHWGTFIIIVGSLITVLLAKTIFSPKENISIIQDKLQKSGVIVTADQAKTIARMFSNKIWDWHIYFGYVLAGLFLFRILLEFFQATDQKLFRTIKNTRKYLRLPTSDKESTRHYLIVKYIYLGFYLILGIMAFTGLFMAFSDDDPDLKAIRKIMQNIHSVGLYVILFYIIVHLGGILFAELSKKHKGIISNMINGEPK